MTTNADRLVSIVLQLKANDRDLYDSGRDWYGIASNIAGQVGFVAAPHAGPGEQLHIGAGVIAALSPQQSWATNQALAFKIALHYSNGGALADIAIAQTGANVLKAWRILQGEEPLSVLGGDKVRAFYTGIRLAGRTDEVCVDRHAVAAYYLPGEATFKNLTPKRYATVAAAYRDAARRLGIPAAQCQAIVWVAWRGAAN